MKYDNPDALYDFAKELLVEYFLTIARRQELTDLLTKELLCTLDEFIAEKLTTEERGK